MPATHNVILLTEEIADFLASCPDRERLLNYRSSARSQKRARELLQKSKEGRISEEENWELDQFEHAEILLQLIKARLRSKKVPRR